MLPFCCFSVAFLLHLCCLFCCFSVAFLLHLCCLLCCFVACSAAFLFLFLQQLVWAQRQARCLEVEAFLLRPTPSPQHKSAMLRKKQAHVDTPIGIWSVHNGVLTIMDITITAALAMAPVLRDLQVAELWSGVGSIVAAAEKRNHNTAAFDLNRVPGVTDVPGEDCEDITMLEGFKKAISLVLRLCEGGLLAVGPDCSSFTFPNSSRHKRHSSVAGDLLYEPVNVGNLMAVIALFLCQLALARRVHFALENPPDSAMFRFFQSLCPDFMRMVMPDSVEESRCQGLHIQSVHRCPYDDGPEPKLQKVYKWLATWRGIKTLNARCKCKELHRTLGKTSPDGAWTGNLKLLAESAAYPKRLGEALLASWVQGSKAITISWSNAALGLVCEDPRTGDECSEAWPNHQGVKRRQKAQSSKAQPSELGPWGSITELGPRGKGTEQESRSQESKRAKKGSQGVMESREQDLGPWSAALPTTEGSHASHQMVASSIGPWSSLASSSSSSSPFGQWESAMASKPANTDQHRPPSHTLGPWGNAAPSSSSEEERDAEAAPGQIGGPCDH